MTDSDDDRLARLERAVDELRREVEALRGAPGAAPRAPVAPPRPRPVAPPSTLPGAALLRTELQALRAATEREGAVEDLVGRYGTVALATLMILMGVGAFLTWAIATFTVGPVARVALGVLAAMAIAAAGLWLRRRAARAGDDETAAGSRRFGDTLLALALAVAHVDAWGAGPYLHLVPDGVALAVAAVASVALAALAWRARARTLFVVGTGGALVAPFVTGAGPGHPFVLPVYGWIVVTAAMRALHEAGRTPDEAARWRPVARVLSLGGAAYAAALLGDATAAAAIGNPAGLATWEARRSVPALFALACALSALALAGAAYAGALALAFLVTTLGTLYALGFANAHGAPVLAAIALAATLTTYAALRRAAAADAGPHPSARAAVAFLLPLGLLGAAVIALAEHATRAGAAALAWVGAAVVVAIVDARAIEGDGERRARAAVHATVATIAGGTSAALLLHEHDVSRVLALAAVGAAGALAFRRLRRRSAALGPAMVLVGALLSALALLRARPAYAYTPFVGRASLAAAAVVAACALLAWTAWPAATAAGTRRGATLVALVGLAPTAALLWGREELARAVSPDVSTFLLVGWFAAYGIAAIFVGRARRFAVARQAGLALAIYAAVKALAQASQLDPVGLRVGSYLLVGGFLLAVGYWYRAAGGRPARPSDAAA